MTDRHHRRSIGAHPLAPESLVMSYGYDPVRSEGAVKIPIFMTSTFAFESAEAGKAFFEVAYGLRQPAGDEQLGLIYSRINNPDLEILEDRLTLFDGAESAAVFASGMAAITTSLLAVVEPGDAVVYSAPIYGGSNHFVRQILPRFGVTPIPFPAGVPFAEVADALHAAIGDRRLGAVLLETPANPTNGLVDIRAASDFAHARATATHTPPVLVDNTFLGPIFQQPLAHGADVVLYSATKYIGGHSDVIAGAALGSRERMAPIRAMRTFLGTMAGPYTGWLLLRSLETLKLRMEAAQANAARVAAFLGRHQKVRRVDWLGDLTESDPMYAVYRRQCGGPGAMISFDVHGGEPEAFRFLNALRMVRLAVSLGGTESLAQHPASMTHIDVSAEDKDRFGIGASLVRLSVGIEAADDIIADLAHALTAV
jgi:methionine-gamma-lyase